MYLEEADVKDFHDAGQPNMLLLPLVDFLFN